MRTLDEEIAHQREVAEKIRTEHNCECDYYDIGIDCVKCAEEHEQLAEWLEELKELRLQNHLGRDEALIAGRKEGYNKALDDFANTLKENYDYLPQIFTKEAFVRYIDEYAEQLKAGVED